MTTQVNRFLLFCTNAERIDELVMEYGPKPIPRVRSLEQN